MYDKNTKNKSFVDMWRCLQDQGIENNNFMLKLINPELEGFDINDLKTEDKVKRAELLDKVVDECMKNIWFFFREVVRIPNEMGTLVGIEDHHSPFILNPINMAMIYLYDYNQDFIACNILNSGGTTTTLNLLKIYYLHFGQGSCDYVKSYIIDTFVQNIVSDKRAEYLENNVTASYYKSFYRLLYKNDVKSNFFKYNIDDLDRLQRILDIKDIDGLFEDVTEEKPIHFLHINNFNPDIVVDMVYKIKNNDEHVYGVTEYVNREKRNPLNDDSKYLSMVSGYLSTVYDVLDSNICKIFYDRQNFIKERIYILNFDY